MWERKFSKRWKMQMGMKIGVVFLIVLIIDRLIYRNEELYMIPFFVTIFSVSELSSEITNDNRNIDSRDINVFWILNGKSESLGEGEKLRINNYLEGKNKFSGNWNLFFLILLIVGVKDAVIPLIIGMIIADKEMFNGVDRVFKNYTKIKGVCNGIGRQGRKNREDLYYVSVIDYVNKKEVILTCEERDLYRFRVERECTFVYGKISKELLYLY